MLTDQERYMKEAIRQAKKARDVYKRQVGVLGGKRGSLAVLVYILLGAIGVPVFAGFSGGLGILLNNTGGYIIGFLFSALVMWAMECLWGKKPVIQILSMVVGLIVCYAMGTIWFMVVYTRTSGAVGLGTVLGLSLIHI